MSKFIFIFCMFCVLTSTNVFAYTYEPYDFNKSMERYEEERHNKKMERTLDDINEKLNRRHY